MNRLEIIKVKVSELFYYREVYTSLIQQLNDFDDNFVFVDSIKYDTVQNQKSAVTTNAKNNKYLEEKTKLENKAKRYSKYYYDLEKKLKYNVLDDQSKIILFTIYQNKNLKEAGIKLGYCKQQIHRKARRIYKLLEKNYFENI